MGSRQTELRLVMMLFGGRYEVSRTPHEFIECFFGLSVQLRKCLIVLWLTLPNAAAATVVVLVRCSGLLSSADAVCVLYLTSVESLGEERSMVPLMSGNLIDFLLWMRWCWG